MTIFLLLTVGAIAGQARRPPPEPDCGPAAKLLDVGDGGDEAWLGFGWSRRERGTGPQVFRWIKHLEADAEVELGAPRDREIRFSAAPMYLDWRRQRIGLFVNGRYVTAWTCPDNGDFTVYQARVPASFWKVGANRLTLRMGYRKRHRSDRRELSLAVDWFCLDPINP